MESEHVFPPRTTEMETFFDTFIEMIGEKRIDSIVGMSPSFPNADYIIDKYEMLVELKILESDFIKEDDIPNLTNRILSSQKSADKAKKCNLLEFQSYFKEELDNSLVSLIRRRLGRIVEKANKQIKFTKKNGVGVIYKGVLVIINDKFTKVDHENTFRILCSVLSQHNSSVDCLVYTTVNLWVDDGTDIAKLPWLTAYGDNTDDVFSGRVNSLGRDFFFYLEKKGIIELKHHEEFESLDKFPKMRHIPLD